ncbi:hypothetical protein T484DRAFT_1777733 [Baffinella frigidus]|nr:hypothetical protein T484DRAFT_1777733 [Cryptophyta sp. CCMP2293]
MPSIPEEREGPADAMRSLQDRALDVVVQQLLSWKETTVQLRSLGRWSSLPSDLLGRILARLADNLKEITEAPAQVALKVRNHDFWLEALDVAVSAEPWGKRPTALSGHLRAQERLNTTVLSRLTCIVALALHGGAGCTEVFEVLPKLEKLEVLSVRTGGQAPTPRPSKDTLGPCLAKCKRLRALDISDTEIGDDTVKFLRMLESLELLHICARKCSETGILALVRPPAAVPAPNTPSTTN